MEFSRKQHSKILISYYSKDELFAGFSWVNLPSMEDLSKQEEENQQTVNPEEYYDTSSSELDEEIELAAFEIGNRM